MTEDSPSTEPVPKELQGLDFTAEAPADISVSQLDDLELKTRLDAAVSELLARGEALKPKTDTGRDLHSIRTALLVEMAKRGLR